MKIINQFQKLKKNSKIALRLRTSHIDIFLGDDDFAYGVEIKLEACKNVNKKYERLSLQTIKRGHENFILIKSKIDNENELVVFAYLIEYLIFELSKRINYTSQTIKKILDDWHSFSKEKTKQISIEKQIGLFGELLMLSQLFNFIPGANHILNWQGPEGSKIDFIYNNEFGIEIKSRIQPFKDWIKISSVEQLDNTLTDQHLIIYDFIPSDTGSTIKQVVDELINQITDYDQINLFLLKLEQVGFDFFSDYTNLVKVNHFSTTVFNTKQNDFPFLRKVSNLRIDKIKYEINLKGIDQIQFSETISKARG